MHGVAAGSRLRNQKCKKLTGSEHLWTFERRFVSQAHGAVHLVKGDQNVAVSSHFPKRWQAWGVGHLKKVCKDACRLAGAVLKIYSSEMLEVRALIS